ncbi:SidA/IucD/PvdA family monooxygenase [Streptomyces diacarni]|uniref:SidA/IucD/PvdA family monooxygenase n=1 Tax=Streptomyces diacarni TaxID=2800381 RepID=UPI0033F4CFD1
MPELSSVEGTPSTRLSHGPRADQDTSRRTVVVVGAGPKAAAVAAKTYALNAAGLNAPRVVIVERARIGEHWRAGGGRTTGRLRLGTPPEKDVGYPYANDAWRRYSAAVNTSMQGFTWARYLVEHGLFHRWVDRGRPQPLHEEWAEYITWVIERSEADLIHATVKSVERDGAKWKVTLGTDVGPESLMADGVVLTTGPSAPGSSHSRVMTEPDFWARPTLFDSLDGQSVVVVGGGEGAAAALVELTRRMGPNRRLTVIAPSASIYTRAESGFENRLFSDPTWWPDLGEAERLDFIRRTDRGVFSGEVVTLLMDSDISFISGRVADWQPAGSRIAVRYEQDNRRSTIHADWLVLCTAPEIETELRIVDQELLKSIYGQSVATLQRLTVARGVQYDLSISDQAPGLHAPGFAALAQGPGFSNLSCLGLLSDRILKSYVSGASRQLAGTREENFA